MFPKRGAFATLITVVALVAILAYKTPELSIPADPPAYVDMAGDQFSIVGVADSPVAPVSPAPSTLGGGAGASGASPSPGGSSTAASPSLGPPATPGSTAPTRQPTPSATPPAARQPTPGSTPAPGTPTAAPTPPPTAAPVAKPTPAPGFTGTIDGTVVNMKYGPVQVRVVFSNGKMTDVIALQTPTAASESVQLAKRAVPILRSEALAAQSAAIDTVSGATYTSNAYKASLQAAISQA
jgi:uncharacterized protein with FMN-binding domain